MWMYNIQSGIKKRKVLLERFGEIGEDMEGKVDRRWEGRWVRR